jgi:hypothetical protein
MYFSQQICNAEKTDVPILFCCLKSSDLSQKSLIFIQFQIQRKNKIDTWTTAMSFDIRLTHKLCSSSLTLSVVVFPEITFSVFLGSML